MFISLDQFWFEHPLRGLYGTFVLSDTQLGHWTVTLSRPYMLTAKLQKIHNLFDIRQTQTCLLFCWDPCSLTPICYRNHEFLSIQKLKEIWMSFAKDLLTKTNLIDQGDGSYNSKCQCRPSEMPQQIWRKRDEPLSVIQAAPRQPCPLSHHYKIVYFSAVSIAAVSLTSPTSLSAYLSSIFIRPPFFSCLKTEESKQSTAQLRRSTSIRSTAVFPW